MTSFVDVVTTGSEIYLAILIVLLTGFFLTGTSILPIGLSSSLNKLAHTVLLPALIVTHLSVNLNLKWVLALWPYIPLALLTRGLSLGFGWGLYKLAPGSFEPWFISSLTFSNTQSYPLIVVTLLSSQTDLLEKHLKWRILDTTKDIVTRAKTYYLVNVFLGEILRIVITTYLLPKGKIALPLDDEDGSGEVEPVVDSTLAAAPADEESVPTESTPLIGNGTLAKKTIHGRILGPLKDPNTIILSTVVALVISCTPLKKILIGEPGSENGFWDIALGGSLTVLGGLFAGLSIFATGSGLKVSNSGAKSPPTLGIVLLLSLWKYAALPAIVISTVYGCRKLPTKVFYYDPVFAFVAALGSMSPPTMPTTLTSYTSTVHLQTIAVTLLSSVTLAANIATFGHGITFESNFDLKAAFKSALGGGVAGAAAMIIQVLTLMPLRTVMNYQYRFGGGMKDSIMILWNDGGLPRYYAGLTAALFQGPLSRFGDTFANAGIIALLASLTWPVLIKTVAASFCAALFRMTLTPIDSLKTTQQTQGGAEGLRLLKQKIKERGIASLWFGAIATAAATFVGHYPWFATYNWLSEVLPPPHNVIQKLSRSAFIGFCASVVSDTVSNSLRVVKTYRQVHEKDVSYVTAAKEIIARDGILGLFGRGLKTRILTNGLQGLLFSILWKLFTDLLAGKK